MADLNELRCCGTCKFYDSSGALLRKDTYDDEPELGRCQRIPHWSECWGHDNETGEAVLLEYESAYVEDASGYSANLYVRPHFGCLLWAPKDDVD